MLADLLLHVRTTTDLPPVFAALGYTPWSEPLDDGSLVVARWRAFEVLARNAERPRDEARSLASRLAARTRRALAVAVGSGQVAIAAPRLGGSGSTRVLVLSVHAPEPLALDILARLAPMGSRHALSHALRVRELLSTEGVGERFYRSFRDLFDRMVATLGARGAAADRHAAALLALTRVLFLYFVQAKGWLDGRPDYLRRLLDAALGRRRHFHRSALQPLFFGSLNRKPSDRGAAARLGRIPYLNGGLFQPHPAERRLGGVLFPNDLWRDAFDGLFERFRFCVRESQDADAIAPDMLGHVFERVMDPGDRRSTGTFYTPEPVVRRMVDAALEAALPAATRSLPALRAIRLLDPAVGSGAFLLGALDRLTELRLGLGERGSRCAVRRQVLRDNLFGVDLSPVAVRLAELRLWLAVIADDTTADIDRVSPLPNLDGVIRQGDTLLDPLGAARAVRLVAPQAAARAVNAVHAARRSLFDARGAAHEPSARELRRVETGLARDIVAGAVAGVDHRLRELEAEADALDLFGIRKGLSPEQLEECRRLEQRRAELALVAGRLADGQLPFFSFEVHAADIIAAGGFHAVIGNPPWVRAERLTPTVRHMLRGRFTWWTAAGGPGYRHQPDLAVAFLQRALELAAPGGAVALLLPSKLLTSQYAETARRHLARDTRVACVHRVSEPEAARFGAVTYPTAVVLQKRAPTEVDTVRLGFDGSDSVAQQRLAQPGPWILVPDREREALQAFRAAGTPLAALAPPSLGVKTGADAVFIGRVLRRHRASAVLEFAGGQFAIEASLVRPVLRGRDIDPFAPRPVEAMIWTHDRRGAPLGAMPPLALAYLEAHRVVLERRADFDDGPLWTVFRARPALARHIVVWPDIARRPAAVVLKAGAARRPIPLNTCYVCAPPSRALAFVIATVLNSTWSAALARALADEARGGYRRLNARVAGAVPIPGRPRTVKALASVGEAAHGAGGMNQDDLDDVVADALGLTASVRDGLRRLAARR